MTVNNKAFASLAKRLAKQTTAQLETLPEMSGDKPTAVVDGVVRGVVNAVITTPIAAPGFLSALKKYPAREIGGIVRSNFNPDFALKLLSDHRLSGVMKLPALVQPRPEEHDIDLPILNLAENVPTVFDSLDQWQKAALYGLTQQQFANLIGAAGTGKTFTLKQLVKKLEANIPTIDLNLGRANIDASIAEPDYNIAVGFCAFTGKAVQQMKRSLPIEYHPLCMTIHKMLGYAPEYVEYISERGEQKTRPIFKPSFTKHRKLPYRVIVIDESSMTPIKLWNELFDAALPDCRFIMVGDINQLPPVQGRSVFGFAMTQWPTFELKEIWRQKIKNADGTWTTAEANPIVENAWAVLQGKFPKKYPAKFDMLP